MEELSYAQSTDISEYTVEMEWRVLLIIMNLLILQKGSSLYEFLRETYYTNIAWFQLTRFLALAMLKQCLSDMKILVAVEDLIRSLDYVIISLYFRQ